MAVAPDVIHRVESVEEVAALESFETPVALLAQTTLSHRDWSDVLEATKARFPDMWVPGRSDLCFATTNRQTALMTIAPQCDAVVVVGSANSSNTLALEKLAREAGCPQVFRVNDAQELPDDLTGTVGVTAGASAPEDLVEAVIARLSPVHGVEEVRTTEEDEYFPPPRNLRDLLAAVDSMATFALGGDPAGPTGGERPQEPGELGLGNTRLTPRDTPTYGYLPHLPPRPRSIRLGRRSDRPRRSRLDAAVDQP